MQMKKSNLALFVSLIFLFSLGFTLFEIDETPVKIKFDFSELEGRTLLIPELAVSEKFKDRKTKKGKIEDVEEVQERIDNYNANWKMAMAESSYDATDYEIRGFSAKELFKEKNEKVVFIMYFLDDKNNRRASMIVPGPKKKVLTSLFINNFDTSDKNDIRLMMNMFNQALHQMVDEQEESGEVSYKALRSKYKKRLIEFFDAIGDMTFLVPEAKHKNPDKAAERTAELKAALESSWTLSNYELTTEEDIEAKRLEGDESSYYWRDIPIYTGSPIVGHYNLIISTASDEVLFGFLGKGRLKPSTLETTQTKMMRKVQKYKKQLTE